MSHWFDGLAMLHRFGIADGRSPTRTASSRARPTAPRSETGEITYSEFATDPCRSLFKRVDVDVLAEALRQRERQPRPARRALHRDDRDADPGPVRRRDARDGRGRLRGPGDADHRPPAPRPRRAAGCSTTPPSSGRATSTASSTSAPDADGARGDRPTRRSTSPPTCTRSGSPSAGSSSPSSRSSSTRCRLALSGRPYIENYRWKPELGTRFTLIDRATGEAAGPFETDACFGFHHINAYEDGGEVVVDICAFADAGIVEDLYLERLRAGKPVAEPELRRFRIDPATGTVDRRAAGRAGLRAAADQLRPLQRAPYRYVWGVGDRRVRLARADRQGRPRATRDDQPGREPRLLPGRAGVRRRAGRRATRTRACCSRSSSTPSAGRSFLLVLDAARPRASWPAPRPRTTSRSASTASSRAADGPDNSGRAWTVPIGVSYPARVSRNGHIPGQARARRDAEGRRDHGRRHAPSRRGSPRTPARSR